MPDNLINNAKILESIKNLKKDGAGVITDSVSKKEDILQTIVLLYFFKQKGKVLDTTEQTLPNIRLVDIHPNNSEKEEYLRLEYIIRDLLNHMNLTIYGTTTDTEKVDSLIAKKNLARIMYFIAMDACDAIVDTSITPPNTQYRAFISNNKMAVLSKRVNNTDVEKAYIKKLFIIASSLAQNQVTIEGEKTQQPVCNKVLRFMPDIINTPTLFTEKEEFIVKNLNDFEDNNAMPKTIDIVFDTQFPEINTETAVRGTITTEVKDKINIRVIQTILIGNGVVPKIEQKIDFQEDAKNTVSHIIDMLYKAFKIDPASCTEKVVSTAVMKP